ncbi:MAG: hypothetical protein JSS72_03660 [Armatimonadetes bacterium]|nr:hypothetical protein [Armatimonadota bacterium]
MAILCCLVCLPTPSPAQESLAKTYREQALAFRKEAEKLRAEASKLRYDAGVERDQAKGLREQSNASQQKGDRDAAAQLRSKAQALEDDAATKEDDATTKTRQCGNLEATAGEKEWNARRIEETSKAACDQLYRREREVVQSAIQSLDSLKQHQKATRVGRETMSVRWLFSHVHDEELKILSESDLNDLFINYETKLAELERQVEIDRDTYATGSRSEKDFAWDVFDLEKDVVNTIMNAEFTLVPKGYDTFEATCYKIERKLNAELAAAEEQLRHSNIPEADKEALLKALKDRQSEDRRKVFMELAPKYRSEKNRVAFFRREWMAIVTELHDLEVQLSKGDDVHRSIASEWTSLFANHFTAERVAANSVAMFAFGTGSMDRFITPWGSECAWLNAKLFPDIQEADAPGVLRMQSIVDNSKSLFVQGGKYDGAAKTIHP